MSNCVSPCADGRKNKYQFKVDRYDKVPQDTQKFKHLNIIKRPFSALLANVKVKKCPYKSIGVKISINDEEYYKLGNKNASEGQDIKWKIQKRLDFMKTDYQIRCAFLVVQLIDENQNIVTTLKINLYLICTGPYHQDFMLKFKDGKIGRISFDFKVSQMLIYFLVQQFKKDLHLYQIYSTLINFNKYYIIIFIYLFIQLNRNFKKILTLFMNSNDLSQSNNFNQSRSFDNLNHHNQTYTELIKKHNQPQIIENLPSLITNKSINSNLSSNNNITKPIHLNNNPINLQPIHVFIKNQSAENINIDNNHQQSNQAQFISNKLRDIPVQFQRKQSFMRPKTMVQIEKKYQMTSQTIKHKLPLAIIDLIMKNAKINNPIQKSQPIMTKTGKMLGDMGFSKKLDQKYNTKKCNICQIQLPQKQFQKMTKVCSHQYCSSCLQQYVIYKIKSFEAVQCPSQGCHQLLDQQSKLYKQLPLQVRKKYKKLLQYQMIKQHPNRKMCPEQKCQGWIEVNQQINTICNVCKKQYCPKCLLLSHEGDCDNRQLQFFQSTLHYRQCNKCKNIIEKSSGCIHMTCRCGYQFCYLCGAKWKHSHTCSNPEQQPIIRQRVECCCCEIQICVCDCDVLAGRCDDCIQDCACCPCCNDNDCCGCECCEACQLCQCDWESEACCCPKYTILIILKFLVLLGFMTVIIPLLLGYLVLMGLFWIGITLFFGMTMYTVEFITELQGYWVCIAIAGYPFTMFIGIWRAFQQIFNQNFTSSSIELLQSIRQQFVECLC